MESVSDFALLNSNPAEAVFLILPCSIQTLLKQDCTVVGIVLCTFELNYDFMHMYYWKFDLFLKYITPLLLFF